MGEEYCKILPDLTNFEQIEGTQSLGDSDLQPFITFYRKLLLSNGRNDSKTLANYVKKLLYFSEGIFSSVSTAEVFVLFCKNGASTAFIIQNETRLPEPTVYRIIKKLKTMDLIYPVLKIPKNKSEKGGPRPTIWAIMGASKEETNDAVRLHAKLTNPKFKLGEEVAQTILDKYVHGMKRQEISYRELILYIREFKTPFKVADIAQITYDYLIQSGIRVWK